MLSKLVTRVPTSQARIASRFFTSMGRSSQGVSSHARKYKQYSKDPILKNNGELPLGEIPEPLNYIRPFEMTTLSNGIRVATEHWPSRTSAIGVFVGGGSRDETPETSGSAHFLEHLQFKGTSSRSRTQLEKEVENLGAQLNAYTTREHTLYHMQVFNNHQEKAMDVLSDMLTNSLYNNHNIEIERDTITQELEETNKDLLETCMEHVYSNIYKDHMMGYPILGDMKMINSITREMIVDFHNRNYFGDNMVVVGTGNVNHSDIVDMAEKYFGKVVKGRPVPRLNGNKPKKNIETMFFKDDGMFDGNIGIFYDAPDWYHKDYYGFLLLQRVFGSYNIETDGESLGTEQLRYHAMHGLLAGKPDITKHESIYSPYSDTAIFGHYISGSDALTKTEDFHKPLLDTINGKHLSDFEVTRARNRLYHELMQIQTVSDVLQSIGPQVLYLNRRVQRSEIAQRISHISTEHARSVFTEWISNATPSITKWGPTADGSGTVEPQTEEKQN